MESYKGYKIKVERKIMDANTDFLARMAILILNDLKYKTNREDWLIGYKIDLLDFHFVMSIPLKNGEMYNIISPSYNFITLKHMSMLELVERTSSEALAHFFRRSNL